MIINKLDIKKISGIFQESESAEEESGSESGSVVENKEFNIKSVGEYSLSNYLNDEDEAITSLFSLWKKIIIDKRGRNWNLWSTVS